MHIELEKTMGVLTLLKWVEEFFRTHGVELRADQREQTIYSGYDGLFSAGEVSILLWVMPRLSEDGRPHKKGGSLLEINVVVFFSTNEEYPTICLASNGRFWRVKYDYADEEYFRAGVMEPISRGIIERYGITSKERRFPKATVEALLADIASLVCQPK